MAHLSELNAEIDSLAADLRAQLGTTRGGVDAWTAEVRAAADAARDANVANLQVHARAKAALADQAAELDLAEASSRDTQQDWAAQLSTLRAQAEALAEQENALPNELAAVRAREAETLAGLEGQKRALVEQERSRQHELDHVSRAAQLYERFLGLRFRRQDGALRIAFTNVDPMDPAREFFFAVSVSEEGVYAVVDMAPAVPGVEVLVAALNADNDFARFVREMRARFRSMV